jgi:hypothetical protein
MQLEDWAFNKQQLATTGFTVINNVFTTAEISAIANEIAAGRNHSTMYVSLLKNILAKFVLIKKIVTSLHC